MNTLIQVTKADAGASLRTAVFLEDINDACVMESYFREHMAERDPLFHDTVAPHLAALRPRSSAAQARPRAEPGLFRAAQDMI